MPHWDIPTRARKGSPASSRRHPSTTESGRVGAAARRPGAGGAGVQSHGSSPHPASSRPRLAPQTPHPARCHQGNSVFPRFGLGAAGRGTGPRNFAKWRERGRVRQPPAPLWLPPRRAPAAPADRRRSARSRAGQCSGRSRVRPASPARRPLPPLTAEPLPPPRGLMEAPGGDATRLSEPAEEPGAPRGRLLLATQLAGSQGGLSSSCHHDFSSPEADANSFVAALLPALPRLRPAPAHSAPSRLMAGRTIEARRELGRRGLGSKTIERAARRLLTRSPLSARLDSPTRPVDVRK